MVVVQEEYEQVCYNVSVRAMEMNMKDRGRRDPKTLRRLFTKRLGSRASAGGTGSTRSPAGGSSSAGCRKYSPKPYIHKIGQPTRLTDGFGEQSHVPDFAFVIFELFPHGPLIGGS